LTFIWIIIREWVDRMLWTLIGILVVLWLLGLIFKIGGAVIHVLLIVAALVLVFNLVRNRFKG